MARFQKGHPNIGGRPKGSKNKATLEKEMIRLKLLAKVMERFDRMTDAQLAKAEGVKYLVLRDRKTKKFITLSQAKYDRLKKEQYEQIEIWEHLPSTEAYAYLLNQAIDRPKDQPIEHHVSGEVELTMKQAILGANSESDES